MPKSAKDELANRINADAAKWTEVRDYLKTYGGATTVAEVVGAVESNLADLYRIRDYVNGDGKSTASSDKPKTKRGRKPGLPAKPPADTTQSNGD